MNVLISGSAVQSQRSFRTSQDCVHTSDTFFETFWVLNLLSFLRRQLQGRESLSPDKRQGLHRVTPGAGFRQHSEDLCDTWNLKSQFPSRPTPIPKYQCRFESRNGPNSHEIHSAKSPSFLT